MYCSAMDQVTSVFECCVYVQHSRMPIGITRHLCMQSLFWVHGYLRNVLSIHISFSAAEKFFRNALLRSVIGPL